MIERSAGAVVFREERGKRYYLLLRYPTKPGSKKDYWDLPKGHIEKNEDILNTVKREVFEETGLSDVKIIGGFNKTIKYFFTVQGKTIFKTVVFYLVETKITEVKISEEHTGYKWLSIGETLKQLTFKNAKDVIKKADNFLSKKGI